MTNSQRLAVVRACLTRWLRENRGSEPESPRGETSRQAHPPPFSESILVRDQFYCGRRFHAGSYRAVWFLEEDELKISTDTGQLVCVLSGSEITEMAARSVAGGAESRDESAHILPLPSAPAASESAGPPPQSPAAASAARRAA